ncbi:uncharacterized protein rrp8 [Stigmatopora argus]
MFNEDDDWNDAADVFHHNVEKKKPNSTTVKPKNVGKKSLRRTLQTLGSIPDWMSEDQRPVDSDSDTGAGVPGAGVPHAKKTRKKTRKKRAKVATTTTAEQENNVDVKTEKNVTKKKKVVKKNVVPNGKSAPAQDGAGKEGPPTGSKLSRQQWRNKIKNKRKCKNKFLQDKPKEKDESVAKPLLSTPSITKAAPKVDAPNGQKMPKKRKKTADGPSVLPSKVAKKQREQTINGSMPSKMPKKQREQTVNGSMPSKMPKKQKEQTVNGSMQRKQTVNGSMQREQTVNGSRREAEESDSKRELSKAERLKRERLRQILHQANPEEPEEEEAPPVPAKEEEAKEDRTSDLRRSSGLSSIGLSPSELRSSQLRLRMQQRLDSAHFRYINELLYSSTSGEAKRMFKQDPEAFHIYHRGYTTQVSRWPTNPVDAIISYIKNKPASMVVADFGCGDCKIARSVKNKVHSFDLVATCDLATVCDMAKVPLEDRSVGIAVFCLSLMGTNLSEFLAEANRVLKRGGFLKIAEVASRFENVRDFVNALARLGFKMVSKDTENTHFFSFEFLKTADAPENVKKLGLQLKACLYKKR